MAQIIGPNATCRGFAVDGTAMLAIENVEDPVLDWRYSHYDLPDTDACTNWFVGMTHIDAKDSDEVYIVGTTGGTVISDQGCATCTNSSVVLAKANITDLQAGKWKG